MRYHIYQKSKTGFDHFASTRYYIDASSLFKTIDSGYIVDSTGAMLSQKNM